MIIAATGHRPDKLPGGYSFTTYARGMLIAREYLQALKPSLVITGMAVGWDQAVGVAAKMTGTPYDCYIPFAGQELKWPESAQQRYDYLLTHARRVFIVSPGGYAAWKMHERNKAMVSNADTILALYNGDPAGGTAECVRYAERCGKLVLNAWQEYLERIAPPNKQELEWLSEADF